MSKIATLKKRAEIIAQVRDFFTTRGYLEVETPKIVAYSGQEFNLEPFTTKLFDEKGDEYCGYLITSPEFSCKKLLAAGAGNIFELGKCFRNNEPFGPDHNPEFTMLEWYNVGADYFLLMDTAEEMIRALGGDELFFRGARVNLASPWKKMTLVDAFKKYADIELKDCLYAPDLAAAGRAIGLRIGDNDDFEEIFNRIFVSRIEPALGPDPIFLYDFPVELGALARPKKDDPRFAERVELYIAGLELMNGFSELNDPDEQKKRFLDEQNKRTRLGRKTHPIDPEFLKALESMPECAGSALGVDRLVMLLTGANNIAEVLSFSAAEIFKPRN